MKEKPVESEISVSNLLITENLTGLLLSTNSKLLSNKPKVAAKRKNRNKYKKQSFLLNLEQPLLTVLIFFIM